METTVSKMKVGAKLMFGQYGASTDRTFPIEWLKATPNGDFITAEVLDYICFDARERQGDSYSARMYGNSDYEHSNIILYLNSEEEVWWNPTHPGDAPPNGNNVSSFNDKYNDRCGFLHHFEDYEIDSIVLGTYASRDTHIRSRMRLPSFSDFVGENKFPLFSRKGVRAHGTQDYIFGRGMYSGFSAGSFIEFWLSDLYTFDYPAILTRNGERGRKCPYHSAGLRPVCTIKPETVVETDEGRVYWVKPFGVQTKLFTDDEFFELLGMAQP